jgi:hypothetical protein
MAKAVRTHEGGAMIATTTAAAAPAAVPKAFSRMRSRLPISRYKKRMRIGSHTQYGSVHDNATPTDAAAPRTAPKTSARTTVTGREYLAPSTTGGAPKRRAMTMPYPTPIATIAPNVSADAAVETGVTNVAA